MADASAIAKVKAIIDSDSARKYVVVSAPGKRNKTDIKITDTLYACYEDLVKIGNCKERFALIRERFLQIVSDLNLKSDFKAILDATEKEIAEKKRKARISPLPAGNIFRRALWRNILGSSLWTPKI